MIQKMKSTNKAAQVEISLTVTLTKLIRILEKGVGKKAPNQTKRNLRKIYKLKKQKMKQRRIPNQTRSKKNNLKIKSNKLKTKPKIFVRSKIKKKIHKKNRKKLKKMRTKGKNKKN